MMKINIGNIPRKQGQNPAKVERKPAWYKATNEEITQYTEILQERLVNLDIPATLCCENVHCTDACHREERDDHCIELLCSMIESSYIAIPMSGGRRRPANSNSGNIPGWKLNVEPFRKDSLFWHSVWLSAGRPPGGELHRIMASCRNKYHLAIRKAKQESNSVLAAKFLEASERGEMDLLKDMTY